MTIGDRGVLIVGAGPVGLLLANALASSKVPFVIIDKKQGPTLDSKGLALNITSQLGFELCGVSSKIGESGCKIQRLDIHWNRERFSTINFKKLKTDINYLITQPQCVTEGELLTSLELNGHSVLWNCELVELSQTASHVQALMRCDERTYKDDFRYVVGCDGKHSRVRSYIGAAFQITEYDMHFVLGDYELSTAIPRGVVQYQVFPETFYILVPISPNLTRVVVKYAGKPPTKLPSPEDISGAVNKLAGFQLVDSEPLWISRAPFYNSVADKMRNGRLFIAGDAAHLFSPIGGTGMNSGLLDVQNLAWKLAYTYAGISEPSLLDTYEQERIPANILALEIADRSTKYISDVNIATDFINKIRPVMRNRKNLSESIPAAQSGYLYCYPNVEMTPTRAGVFDACLCETIIRFKKKISLIVGFVYTLILDFRECANEVGQLLNSLFELKNCKHLQIFVIHPRFLSDCVGKPADQNLFHIFPSLALPIRGLMHEVTLVRPDGVIQMECQAINVESVTDILTMAQILK